MLNINRRDFIASLGGSAVLAGLSQDAKADALEHYLAANLAAPGAGGGGARPPTVAELEAQIPTRNYRRGVGDLVLSMVRAEHGFWSAQLFEPYVSAKVTFAIRHHATLRFFPDEEAGYEYPELYRTMFGSDYVPTPHQQAEYEWVRKHRWYMAPRLVTVNDLYSFEPGVKVSVAEFEDVIGRHFRQPKAGLGLDGSPVAHRWRTAANPDAPL